MLLFTKHAKVVGVTRGTRAPSTSHGAGRGVGAVVVDVGPDQHQALRHAERKAQTYGKRRHEVTKPFRVTKPFQVTKRRCACGSPKRTLLYKVSVILVYILYLNNNMFSAQTVTTPIQNSTAYGTRSHTATTHIPYPQILLVP